MINSLGEKRNIILPLPRESNSTITNEHKELAFWIQTEYEKIICKKIESLLKKYNIRNLCMSGGVALNCVANSKILTNTKIENLYIQPAAGDQGQCLGNALYGIHHLGFKSKFNGLSPYLSPAVFVNKGAIESNQNYSPNFGLIHLKRPEIAIALLVNSNKIVGHFYGQGEFGPRALGHRSIFASPINANMKDRINSIKNRESFNPFACTILENHYSTWFYNSAKSSKYMLLADRVKPEFRLKIPAILHGDSTSRVQTISPSDCPRVYEIINQFYQLTDVPLLLNTSLNSNNQPICESISNALKTFADLRLDCIIIDNYLISLEVNREELLSIIEPYQH
jgi:carbamoyltransferase